MISTVDPETYGYDRLSAARHKTTYSASNRAILHRFNSLVAPLGGRFNTDLDSNGESMNSLIRYYQYHMTRWVGSMRKQPRISAALPPIHVDFINNPELNACAFWNNGQGFIGVNIGTIVLLRSLFFSLLCDPSLFPDIGPSRNDPPAIFDPHPIFVQLSDYRSVPLPIREMRRQCSLALTRTALEFIIAHEFAHLVDGHCRMIDDIQSGIPLTEVNWRRSDGITPMLSQAFEMDADAFATSQTILLMLWRIMEIRRIFAISPLRTFDEVVFAEVRSGATSFDPVLSCSGKSLDVVKREVAQSMPMQLLPFNGSEERGLQLWGFAIHTLFRFFEAGEIQYGSLEQDTHPTPPVRMFMSALTLDGVLRAQTALEDLASHLPAFISGVSNAEAAYLALTELNAFKAQTRRVQIAKELTDKDSALGVHQRKIYSTWREIHPELQKLAYVSKLPLSDFGLA